jgi:hypothetical protein
MICGKNYYIFILSFLCFSTNSIAVNSIAASCGESGFVNERLGDCNESFFENFSLLTRSGSKTFWYDKNTQLAWYAPNHGALEISSYHEIKKSCQKPYRLPRLKQLKQLANYAELPLGLKRDSIVLKRRATSRVGSGSVDMFSHYYNLKEKKSKRNRARSRNKDVHSILCVATLEGYFLFKGGQ